MRWLVAILVLSMAFSGCSGDDGEHAQDPGSAETPTEAGRSVALSETELAELRRRVIAGAQNDLIEALPAPPGFKECFLSGFSRELTQARLEKLIRIEHEQGEPATARAMNGVAVSVGDECGGRGSVPKLISAANRLGPAGNDDASESDRSDTVRDCPTRIEGTRLRPGPDDVVAGPIIFYGLRAAARQPPSEYRVRGGGRYTSFKTVTEVEANAEVTVAVAPGERNLALNFDHERLRGLAQLSDLQRTVEFEACAASQPRFSRREGVVGPRTQFNGGFASAGPGCRTFDVVPRQDAEPIRLRVGFGTGQRGC